MPFELKPMGSTNDTTTRIGMGFMGGGNADTIPKIDDIVWTTPRQPLPMQLQGRVPEAEWVATFDALRARCSEDLEFHREMIANALDTGGLPGIPCCLPCIVHRAISKLSSTQREMITWGHASKQAWLSLVQAEQARYAPYGVHVTIAKELRGRSEGDVGLKFDVGDFPATAVAVAVEPALSQAPMDRYAQSTSPDRGGDLAGQLEKMAKLHGAGALSDDEFRAAKNKALGI
jgi:hypothetical protein